MGQFSALHVHPHDKNEFKWVLDQELVYEHQGVQYIAPKGFVTNLASVPRILWSAFPPYGKYTKAAVIHDFLYTKEGGVTRKQADKLFKQMCFDLGVNKNLTYIMYAGIRLFGSRSFD